MEGFVNCNHYYFWFNPIRNYSPKIVLKQTQIILQRDANFLASQRITTLIHQNLILVFICEIVLVW